MAKKINITVSNANMGALLENSVILDTQIVQIDADGSTSNALTELNTLGSCNNFINKRLIPTLQVFADNKSFVKTLVYNTKDGNEIEYVSIEHKVESDFIFEPFKKSGISVGTLNIGIDYKTNDIYVTNNIHAALNKFAGTEKFNALVLYLITLNYLFMNMIKYVASVEYNTYSKLISIKFNNNENGYLYTVNDLIFQVGTGETVYTLNQFDTHEIYRILFNTHPVLSNYNYTAGFYPIGNYTSLKIKDTVKGTEEYGILYFTGLEKGVSLAYLYTYKGIYVNQYMDLPSLDSNSIECILAMRTIHSEVSYMDYLKDKEVSIISNEEILNSGNSESSLYTLIFELLNKADIEEYNKPKELGDFIGIELKVEGNLFDSSTIKAEYDDDEYAQKLYKQIQPYYDDFDLKDLNPAVKGFANGDFYSAIFYGESGSGKSTAARVIASRTGIPFISVNCSTNIEESDLIGCMIPNPDKESAKDQPFIWQDGVLTKALRGNGYFLIVEEGNFARAGILGKLNSLLDEARQIELSNGEILKAPKNFRIIITCNIGYEGTNKFNEAFIDRFELVKEFSSAPRKDLIDIVMSRTGYTNKANVESVLNVYESIRKYSKDNNLNLVVTLRQLLTIFKSGKYFKTAYDAVLNTMVNKAFMHEPDYKVDFIDTVLGAFNLKFKI